MMIILMMMNMMPVMLITMMIITTQKEPQPRVASGQARQRQSSGKLRNHSSPDQPAQVFCEDYGDGDADDKDVDDDVDD